LIEEDLVSAGRVIGTGLRILAVCLLFAVCFTIATALSGLAKIAQQAPPVQTPPAGIALPFLTFSLCAGIAISYLILRSTWNGLKLTAAMFAAIYGISTVATQVETAFFLRAKMPPGMIRALFLEGAIAALLIAPLAVLVLGKWRVAPLAAAPQPEPARLSAASAAWRIAFLILAFEFLYMFFGYIVAWQNPVLRQYYGGQASANFLAAIETNWANMPWLYGLQVFRALLYIACVLPLIRMLGAARWEKAVAVALFLASWTTILLLPNALMPASVARSHFWETLGFNLIFGILLAWLL
jgi:hypothetical protein